MTRSSRRTAHLHVVPVALVSRVASGQMWVCLTLLLFPFSGMWRNSALVGCFSTHGALSLGEMLHADIGSSTTFSEEVTSLFVAPHCMERREATPTEPRGGYTGQRDNTTTHRHSVHAPGLQRIGNSGTPETGHGRTDFMWKHDTSLLANQGCACAHRSIVLSVSRWSTLGGLALRGAAAQRGSPCHAQ